MEFIFYLLGVLVLCVVSGAAGHEIGKQATRKELMGHQHSWRAINATHIRPKTAYAETILGWVCVDVGCDGARTQELEGTWELQQILAAKEEQQKELEWPL